MAGPADDAPAPNTPATGAPSVGGTPRVEAEARQHQRGQGLRVMSRWAQLRWVILTARESGLARPSRRSNGVAALETAALADQEESSKIGVRRCWLSLSNERKGWGTAMFRGFVAVVVVLVVGVPAAAQESVLWSSILTAAEMTDDEGNVLIGYLRSPELSFGELSDPDFDFRGTTHRFWSFAQESSDGGLVAAFRPAMDPQDAYSLTFTLDGHRLAASDGFVIHEDLVGDELGSVIVWENTGFRWTDGQRIAVELTTSGRVPGLSIFPESVTVAEGGAEGYSVTLTTQPSGTVTVTRTSSDRGAVEVDPESLTITVADWRTSRIVAVTGVNDDDAADETATVTHAASGGGYDDVAGTLTVNVDDDETPVPTLPAAGLTLLALLLAGAGIRARLTEVWSRR